MEVGGGGGFGAPGTVVTKKSCCFEGRSSLHPQPHGPGILTACAVVRDIVFPAETIAVLGHAEWQDVDAGIDTEASDEVLDVQPAPDTDAENSARGENQFMNALDQMEDEGMTSFAEVVLAESDGHDSFAEKQAVEEVKLPAGASPVSAADLKTTRAEPADVTENPSLDQHPASGGQEAEETSMHSGPGDAETELVAAEDMSSAQPKNEAEEAMAEDSTLDQRAAAPGSSHSPEGGQEVEKTALHSTTHDEADAELVAGEASAVQEEDRNTAQAETVTAAEAMVEDSSLDRHVTAPDSAVHSTTDDAANAELVAGEASAVQEEDMNAAQAETVTVAEAVAEDSSLDRHVAAPETAVHSTTDDAADAELVAGEASAVQEEDRNTAQAETVTAAEAMVEDSSLDRHVAAPESAVHSTTDDAADAELVAGEASAVQEEDRNTAQAETVLVAEAMVEDSSLDRHVAAPESAVHSTTDDAADAELVAGEASAVQEEDRNAAQAETVTVAEAVAEDSSLDRHVAAPESAVHSTTDDAADAKLVAGEASAVQEDDRNTAQAETVSVAEDSSLPVSSGGQETADAAERIYPLVDGAADAGSYAGEDTVGSKEDTFATTVGKASSNGESNELQDSTSRRKSLVSSMAANVQPDVVEEDLKQAGSERSRLTDASSRQHLEGPEALPAQEATHTPRGCIKHQLQPFASECESFLTSFTNNRVDHRSGRMCSGRLKSKGSWE